MENIHVSMRLFTVPLASIKLVIKLRNLAEEESNGNERYFRMHKRAFICNCSIVKLVTKLYQVSLCHKLVDKSIELLIEKPHLI